VEYAPPAEDDPEWMNVDTPEPAPERARPFTLLDGLRGLSEYLTSRGGRKLRTGIATLDRSTDGGLACGLHVIGGLPGSGKSALALEIALNVVKAGGRVLYLSLEMDRYEVAKRVAQRVWFDETGNTITERGLVDLARQNGKAMDDTLLRGDALWHTQADALEVGDLETLGGGDIDCICQEIAAFRERCAGGKHLPLVIVDYLQYVGSKHNRAQDRRVLLVEIAQKLKAQTLQGEGCVVLGLSSINRDAYYDTPSLEMLKEAGEVEYTAQTVHILGYRFRDYPNREAVRSFVQEHKDDATRHYALYCMKNRGGAPRDAWIDFDAAAMTVSPADNPNPYPAVGTMLPAEKQGKAARKQTKTQLPEA
jgi:replicative DNA helicase